jgi:hypothetical protein
MITFINLARRFAASLVAAQLAFGAVSTTALVSAAPANAAVFAQHGFWQGIAASDGFGARTSVGDVGTAAFIVKGSRLSIVLVDDAWSLNVGVEVPVTVTIDGEVLSGTAVATDEHTVEMSDVRMSVLKQFVDDDMAVVNVNNDIVWTLNLYGFTAAMTDALNAYRAGLES